MKLTKEEALKQIEECGNKMNELKQYIEGIDKKEILVPDCIKFEEVFGGGDGLGIVFNDNKQVVYSYNGFYRVQGANNRYFIPYKLVPVDEKDLKVDYTYFRTDGDDMSEIDELFQYCKYLGKGKYAYIELNVNTIVGDDSRKHRYQVVPLSD